MHAGRHTVDNNITRAPVDRQRGRIGGFCWDECVRLIVDVPRIEKSGNLEEIEAGREIQVEMLVQRLQFLGGGHRQRLSV